MLDKNGKEIIKGADVLATFWLDKEKNKCIIGECYVYNFFRTKFNKDIVLVKYRWTKKPNAGFGSCLVYPILSEDIEIV